MKAAGIIDADWGTRIILHRIGNTANPTGAGSVHHRGSNRNPMRFLHLSWPGSHTADAPGLAVSGSAAVAGSPTEASVATFPTLSTPSRLDRCDESPTLRSRSWL